MNWSKPIKIADPCIAHNNLGKSMSVQNYNRFKEALKMQSKSLQKLRGMTNQIGSEDNAMAASKYFQELLWMFKYSFENTGVHPSLATKLSQIVIKRDDLDNNLVDDFNSKLNLPQGVSAQSSREPTAIEQSFDTNSPIKGGDGFSNIESDLQLGDAGDAFRTEMNNAVSVSDEVAKLVLDQL